MPEIDFFDATTLAERALPTSERTEALRCSLFDTGEPVATVKRGAAATAVRPTMPASSGVTGATAVVRLLRAGVARRRAMTLRDDTEVASPNACEVSCRVRTGSIRPPGASTGLLYPKDLGEEARKWFPRPCQTVVRTDSGQRQS